MTSNTNKNIIFIENLRVLAAFSVILIHAAASIQFNPAEHGSINWLASNFFNSVSRWSVPIFVMISGQLLLSNSYKNKISFLRNKLTKLSILLLGWSFLYLFYSYFNSYISNAPEVPIQTLINRFLSGQPAIHMWYLFMLISFLIVTPFIKDLLSSFSNFRILIISILLLTFSTVFAIVETFVFHHNCCYIPANLPFPLWLLAYLGYFVFSYALTLIEIKINSKLLSALFVISVLITFLGYHFLSLNNYKNPLFMYSFFGPNVTVMSISIFIICKQSPFLNTKYDLMSKLSTKTLGIYLIHPLFLDILSYLPLTFSAWIKIPFISILAFTLSAITVTVLKRIIFIKNLV